jgi:hypothetical protein
MVGCPQLLTLRAAACLAAQVTKAEGAGASAVQAALREGLMAVQAALSP